MHQRVVDEQDLFSEPHHNLILLHFKGPNTSVPLPALPTKQAGDPNLQRPQILKLAKLGRDFAFQKVVG